MPSGIKIVKRKSELCSQIEKSLDEAKQMNANPVETVLAILCFAGGFAKPS
ncbi:hypothetical protein D8674_037854 [Pyrus ussuriensis x Pyrus communis]|uniref:Uncharacterized protein n=1 Tax=Pyrus ussuriensis x Pyrus communis TaxID=2448454 RepID=A0A5N5HCI2_9ROSA|nr:hypothetical protein D8674_037854 [Pyrus ussuriensis x Pyrus communis]